MHTLKKSLLWVFIASLSHACPSVLSFHSFARSLLIAVAYEWQRETGRRQPEISFADGKKEREPKKKHRGNDMLLQFAM